MVITGYAKRIRFQSDENGKMKITVKETQVMNNGKR